MEVILASAFGVQKDIQTDANELYTRNAETLFKQPALSVVLSKFLLMVIILCDLVSSVISSQFLLKYILNTKSIRKRFRNLNHDNHSKLCVVPKQQQNRAVKSVYLLNWLNVFFSM